MTKALGAMLCATLLSTTIASGVVAQPEASDLFNASFVEQVGGDARINFSGKLRMLSQRIPAAACNLHAGITPDVSAVALTGAVKEFDTILAALEFGDDSLGIYGSEERLRTLRVIKEVHSVFDPIKEVIAQEAEGSLSDATLATLADQNMGLLEIAVLLVAEVTGQYANPVALRQSDAMAIDIAGRQRMLTQKMSKEVCLTMSGINGDAAREALAGTMNVFDVSLGALSNGMAEVGIAPPPNEDIENGLGQVLADWTMVQPYIASIRDGGTITSEDRGVVFVGLNTTLKNMNTVVGMYSEASKLGL